MDERESRYYHTLYEIAATLNSMRKPEEIIQSIVQSVAQALEAKGCALMLLNPERTLLLHAAAYGLSDRYIRKGPVSADKSIAKALEGEPVAVVNATEDERIQYRKQAKEEGIASILSVPMLLRGEVTGVVRVYTAEPRHFTQADIYFVGAVANLGAIALENAKLYESVQKSYEELRLELAQWTSALGYEWMTEKPVMPAQD